MSAPGAGAAGHPLFVGADGRVRWFWRLLTFAALTSAAALVLTTVVYPLVATAMSAAGVRLIAFSWISVAALLVAHAVSLEWVDGHRPWSFARLGRESLGPRRIAIGAALGALAIGVPVTLLIASGWMREEPATPGSWWGSAWRFALILLPAALGEELMIRGYPFAVLRERFGWRWAVVATSVVFGLMHVLNPGVTVEAILMVVVAGVFLAAVLLVTESLYAAWAAHFAWNWTMAAVMHAPVSGLSIETYGYRLVDTGPDWATGGAWGPEGGVGALLGMTAGLYFLWSRPAARALFTRRPVATAATTDLYEQRPASRGES
ncbi:MAG TPA: type II CAAX endopeptidase family protein [Gemmatimonadaceae bacterium]|nr:type II CAAX endopeptidase family protein [Gemmatimonadaceae bacterium]